MAFRKTLSTDGMYDTDGEQIEEWEAGDKFRIADHAVENYPEDAGTEMTVTFIEVNEEDFNDFVLYWIEGGDIGYVHRMDAEHAEEVEEPVKNHRDMYAVEEVIHHGDYRSARVVEVYALNETTAGAILESSAYCYGRTRAAQLLADLKLSRVSSIGWSRFRLLAPGEEPR